MGFITMKKTPFRKICLELFASIKQANPSDMAKNYGRTNYLGGGSIEDCFKKKNSTNTKKISISLLSGQSTYPLQGTPVTNKALVRDH